MSDLIKDKILFAATEETVSGISEAVSASDFIETTDAGATMNGPRDKKDINPMSGNRLKKRSRKTIQNGDGAVTSYLRAGQNSGDAPETGLLLESFGFSAESQGSVVSSTGSNTTTVINVASGAELAYKVGQVILIKDSVNGDHVSPISALADGEITILIPASTAFDDSATIAKSINYRLDDKTDKSFTARKYFGGEVIQEIPYCKVSNIEFANIITGEVPTSAYTFSGINFLEYLETLATTPAFDTTEPAFALEACLYKNNVKVEANEVSFSFEQTLAKKKTLCATNGIKSQKGTGLYNVSGSLTVYKNDQEIEFSISDDKYSVFISLFVPGAYEGAKENVISIYIPVCKTDERDTNGDIEGEVTSAISFSSEPNESESSYPIIMFS